MQGVLKTIISSVVCFSYIPCLCVMLNLSPTGNGTYCTLRLASSTHIEPTSSLSDALLLCKRLSHLAVYVAVGNIKTRRRKKRLPEGDIWLDMDLSQPLSNAPPGVDLSFLSGEPQPLYVRFVGHVSTHGHVVVTYLLFQRIEDSSVEVVVGFCRFWNVTRHLVHPRIGRVESLRSKQPIQSTTPFALRTLGTLLAWSWSWYHAPHRHRSLTYRIPLQGCGGCSGDGGCRRQGERRLGKVWYATCCACLFVYTGVQWSAVPAVQVGSLTNIREGENLTTFWPYSTLFMPAP